MSAVKRIIISNPERTSVETWAKITDIICSQDMEAKSEFDKVSNVTASLLSEEFMKDHPMIMKGGGSQLRVYCLYGEDAITGEDANEDQLSWNITEKDWTVFMPCSEEELTWYEKAISNLSDRFKVYDLKDGLDKDEYYSNENPKTEFTVDEEAFKNL
ncbi:MAG TPA: hypothetical protein VGK25_13745 [Ignavibacteria bacterium]|jgi:hypothetical protein